MLCSLSGALHVSDNRGMKWVIKTVDIVLSKLTKQAVYINYFNICMCMAVKYRIICEMFFSYNTNVAKYLAQVDA